MKLSTIIHPIAILVLLLIPVMFIGPDEEITFERYLFKSCMPFMMLLTFYINYLWVLPKHIGGQLRFSIIHINVVLVVVACALVALARAYEYSIFPPRFPMRRSAAGRTRGARGRRVGRQAPGTPC